MADFEFLGTPEERRRQAEVLLMRMNRDMYGNGTPGLLSRMDKFITKHETQQEMRDRQHTENQAKLDGSRNRLNLILVFLGVLATYLVFFKGHF